MANPSLGLPSPASIGTAEEVNLKPYSCLLCRQRKVKCSRTDPCTVCVRSKMKCEYVAPAPARRRGISRPKEGLHARLQRYERILHDYGQKFGIAHMELESEEEDTSRSPKEDRSNALEKKRGRLVSRKGSTRYLDSEIWTNLTKEIEDPTELFSDGSEDEMPQSPDATTKFQPADGHCILFGAGTQNLSAQHPDVLCLEQLWQTFCENVEPLTKLVHTPSSRKLLDKAISNPTQLCRSEEALLFNIYFVTVLSWTEQDCLVILGQPRETVVQKYRALAQQSFVNASLLKTSNVITLQAYTLYLMAMRSLCDTGTLLTLSAVALRIARRIGLHRDGSFLKISPFEVEMRRRLWWTIVMVEFKLAETCGSRPSADLLGDTKVASNLNDADLWPGMTVTPTERDGITDMVVLMIKNYAMQGLANLVPGPSMCPPTIDVDSHSFAERDAIIDKLQETFEQRILRYCDPLVPLHVLVSLMCRAVICKMRVAAHSPFRYADKNVPVTQAARDIVWENGRRLLEYGTLMHTLQSLTRFRWMVGPQFIWDSFIYILGELRHRKAGTDVNHVWEQVSKSFEQYPENSVDANNPNFLAVGVWTLRVWDDTLAAREAVNSMPIHDPPYITQLRKSKHGRSIDAASSKTSQSPTMPEPFKAPYNFGGYSDAPTSGSLAAVDDIFNVPLDGFDWAQFDQVFQ